MPGESMLIKAGYSLAAAKCAAFHALSLGSLEPEAVLDTDQRPCSSLPKFLSASRPERITWAA